MRKPLGPRVSLLAGLAYQQYRTKTSVGTQGQGGLVLNNGVRDVTVDQFYSQGNLETYQNRYHILSLPVEIAIQLNKGSKLPISWQLGLAPGWMISSNALVKARDSSGILYSDKSMFNRFQLGLETGVSFRLFRKSRNALELGPVFQYMLTPVFKNQINYNGHLSFVGLRADWTLFTYKPRQR
jgi:hypothetical protein